MKQFPTHIVAVDGMVENENGEVLLVLDRRGNWTFPGGQVETGENLIDALKREIFEESGAQIDVNRLVCVSSNTAGHKGFGEYDWVPTKVMFGFTCTYLSGGLRGSDETLEARWVAKERLPELITVPSLAERCEAYLNFTGEVQYLEYVTKPEYNLKLKRKI